MMLKLLISIANIFWALMKISFLPIESLHLDSYSTLDFLARIVWYSNEFPDQGRMCKNFL